MKESETLAKYVRFWYLMIVDFADSESKGARSRGNIRQHAGESCRG